MKGFRDFLLRGNIVELAVAVIMGTVFAAVVEAFTKILLDIIGKIFTVPDFSGVNPGGVSVGNFLTALITFILTGFVVYVGVVVPFNKLSSIKKKDEEPAEVAATSEDLLAEIRDLLRAQAASSGTELPPARTVDDPQ